MLSLKLSFLLLASVASTAAECPYGYTQYYGLCIKYLGSGSLSAALYLCPRYGGRLIEPRSKGSSDYFASMFTSGGAWLGIQNFRYASTGEPISYSQNYYFGNNAYLHANGYWYSTTSHSASLRIYCEYVETNTACPMVGIIYDGDTFSATQYSCQKACERTSECTFWTYTNGECGLRSYTPGDLAGGTQTTSTTGFKNSVTPGQGRVLVGKTFKDVEDAQTCQNLCAQYPECKSYTWTYLDTVFGNTNTKTCILNYGKNQHQVEAAGVDWQRRYVVSGPPCCYTSSACDTKDIQYYGNPGEISQSRSGSNETALPTDKELEQYAEELKAMITNGTDNNGDNKMITTLLPPPEDEY